MSPDDCWYCEYSETITNDYVTCTAWLGDCNDYTEAQLVSTDYYNGVDPPYNGSMSQYCGAAGWTCQGIAGVSNQAWNGSYEQDTYGPQLYNSNDGSQSKYARTQVHLDGSYTFYNTCVGWSC
jgi:hypothetical protein